MGITRGTGAAHIARAALESIAYQSLDLIECMSADAGAAIGELRVDGGAAANDTLMQFQADMLGVPVLRPPLLETTAWGAACLAGLAAGCWQNVEEIRLAGAEARTFQPRMNREKTEQLIHGWRRAVERSRNWIAS
jgi:glycerol kinase